ncbi:hypothetical protein PSECIP111951_03640 [Pseudoalteromonas holothuriae]|uniref:Bacteriocin n=1 Tax=Pseudoalteromonas holothuriae TaxID=2963714 RepID=A0A9W4VXU9_9GAMM|nr:hypothetical protein PSECIP111854_03031 [Pseudoalteromonas sp. CIP111854]CAH9066764.1 hypothetical protein PSECIP111951_03640 [Pseudoalteromonas sp. CIP111951]
MVISLKLKAKKIKELSNKDAESIYGGAYISFKASRKNRVNTIRTKPLSLKC